VATGHHADDQRDTVLLKLLRGAHLSRLAGMAPASPPFVRPLLRCRKTELASLATARGVAWAEDRSNLSAGASRRNAVRLRLVPLLRQLTDGALDARLEDAAHQSAALRAMLDAAPRVATRHAAERGFDGPFASGGHDDEDDEDDDDLLGHEAAEAASPPLADAALGSGADDTAVFVSGELDTERCAPQS
jgi:tRNA(Ile)-lysidine synthase TilS/MesJ